MKNRNPSQHIILFEVLGFGLIILLTWLDELINLPSVLFGGVYQTNYPEAIIESLIVLLVAITVILFTRRILDRLHYLEGFLRVCAWCRNVEHDGQWLPLEDYFKQRFNMKSSHGMCPECFARVSKENEDKAASASGSGAAGGSPFQP